VKWRRRETKSRDREGRDGDGEPPAQCCRDWRCGEGMFVVSNGKKMEEQEGWVREEEEWKLRREVEEDGHEIEGEVGWQW
jgi:hypothetical protein